MLVDVVSVSKLQAMMKSVSSQVSRVSFTQVASASPVPKGCPSDGKNLIIILLNDDNSKSVVLPKATKGVKLKEFSVEGDLGEGTEE